MRITTSLIILFATLTSLSAQNTKAKSETWNKNPYPYGNPVIKHMYTADAAPKVMPDGKVWMVTSVDSKQGGGYATMHSVHAFSTSDMVHWKDEGEILSIADLNQPEGEDWAIWAPDIVYRNGTYYLYFPMRNLLADGSIDRYVAVAESKRMDKRFTVTNPRMKGVPTAGLDPAVFIDDDGQAYLYWNQTFMGLLTDDMREIEGKPFKLNIGASNFMEASWMHKRNGKYYFNYHTKYDGKVSRQNPDDENRAKSHIDYSMGDSPRGPLQHMGVMNYELGVGVVNGPKLPGKTYVPWRLTQSNHGAVVEFHGQEYFFYHTSALSSWRQDEFKDAGTWTQRSVCVDSLNYNADGTVIPVKQTVEGVGKVEIDQPYQITLQKGWSALTQNKAELKFDSINLGTGYYYLGFETKGLRTPTKFEVRLDSSNGTLIGTIMASKEGVSETFLRGANGRHSIVIIAKDLKEEITLHKIRVFAGSPK